MIDRTTESYAGFFNAKGRPLSLSVNALTFPIQTAINLGTGLPSYQQAMQSWLPSEDNGEAFPATYGGTTPSLPFARQSYPGQR